MVLLVELGLIMLGLRVSRAASHLEANHRAEQVHAFVLDDIEANAFYLRDTEFVGEKGMVFLNRSKGLSAPREGETNPSDGGRHIQFKRDLANLPYDAQIDAIKPPRTQPVQLERADSAHADERHADADRTAEALMPVSSGGGLPSGRADVNQKVVQFTREWDQLSGDERQNWSTLGWDSDSWNNDTRPLSPIPSTVWGALNEAQQAAATALEFNRETWNDRIDWNYLTPEQQQHWTVLGWGPSNWDGAAPPSASLRWRELNDAQRVAASGLLYDHRRWNADIVEQGPETGTDREAASPEGTPATGGSQGGEAEQRFSALFDESGEFASISHVFPHEAAERLDLFTPEQRTALLRFSNDHVVPARLFHGSAGSATPQHRILVAAHILEVGSSDGAEVRAGSCGDFARLVYDYANVSPPNGGALPFRRTPNNSELRGGDNPDVDSERFRTGGARPPADQGDDRFADIDQRIAFYRNNELITAAAFGRIEPGDWLEIYNGYQRSPSSRNTWRGLHSVIFLRWHAPLEEGQTSGRAIVIDQGAQGDGEPVGGDTSNPTLGTRFRESPLVCPVHTVNRVVQATPPS